MNKNQKNKRIQIYWKTAMKQMDPYALRTIRAIIGVPENGFINEKDEEYLKWLSKSIKEIKPLLKQEKNLKKLDTKMRETNYGKYLYFIEFYKEKHPLLKNGFNSALSELLFFGDPSVRTLNKIEPYNVGNYACKIIRLAETSTLDKGLYIKIGSETTGDQLKDLINDKNKEIKKLQRELYPIKNTVPESQLFDRNEKVWLVSQIPKIMLRDLIQIESGNKHEKYSLACQYLRKKYNIKINPGTYRKVVSDENKVRKNRYIIDINYLDFVKNF